ncbi:prepilin peptidase [Wenzhouxiangella sp. AB-CW3]|uniref:prepilin peptidase n=1 Tax=Wenzhouxiangella sp. AB-CW3 TaxID=2771012 RepID=UPI00168BE64D|nr:A24 family peptidase [Wenzhouxiangella sp. AB-CW3]QOC23437.1 prepilin peptidase [Wenzhouxiangella sp. AB-CW3]
MIEVIQALHPAVLVAAVFVFGLLIGSFLNVVILRYPRRLLHDWQCQCRELLELEPPTDQPPPDLVKSRSHCPSCRNTIAWYDNIPVISWIVLGRKCRHCGTSIAFRYPLVELATAILSAVVIWHFGASTEGLAALVLTWTLIAATGIDIDHQLLPDQVTLPLLWLGLALNLWLGLFATLEDAVIGAIAGYGSLWLVYHGFRLATGKEGMGYGDFKLLGALGAWLGWQALPMIILGASLVGAIVGLVLMVAMRRGREIPIAFGPYLAAAGWIAMIWGDRILDFWLVY